MYASTITRIENEQYKLTVYEERTGRKVYEQLTCSYDKAREKNLNFLYKGPARKKQSKSVDNRRSTAHVDEHVQEIY